MMRFLSARRSAVLALAATLLLVALLLLRCLLARDVRQSRSGASQPKTSGMTAQLAPRVHKRMFMGA